MNDILYNVILQDLKNFKMYLNGLVINPKRIILNEDKQKTL